MKIKYLLIICSTGKACTHHFYFNISVTLALLILIGNSVVGEGYEFGISAV